MISPASVSDTTQGSVMVYKPIEKVIHDAQYADYVRKKMKYLSCY